MAAPEGSPPRNIGNPDGSIESVQKSRDRRRSDHGDQRRRTGASTRDHVLSTAGHGSRRRPSTRHLRRHPFPQQRTRNRARAAAAAGRCSRLRQSRRRPRMPQRAVDGGNRPAGGCPGLRDHGHGLGALDATGEAYQVLERFDEVLSFHTRALALHKDLDDRSRAAVVLCNIGDAYRRLRTDSAERYYQEALELIAEYTDQRANALRVRLIAKLGVDLT